MEKGTIIIEIYLLGIYISAMVNGIMEYSKLMYIYSDEIRDKFFKTTKKTVLLTLLSWAGVLYGIGYAWYKIIKRKI